MAQHFVGLDARPAARALAGPLAFGALLGGCAVYIIASDPAEGVGFLPCPLRTVTGLWCPGCGLTRATHHLFRGDFAQALSYNVFIVPVLTVIVLMWARALRRAGQHDRLDVRDVRSPFATRWFAVAMGAVMLVFATVRNLPGFEFLIGEIDR